MDAKTVKPTKKIQFMKGYFVVFLVLVALFVFMTIINNKFLTYDNLTNLARSTAINGIVALAITFVIVTGGIDLSVGTNLGLGSMVFTLLIEGKYAALQAAATLQAEAQGLDAAATKDFLKTVQPGIGSILLFALIAVAVCGVLGVISGILINDGKLPPFIATLGIKTITRAVILLISGGQNITIHSDAFKSFAKITLGVPGVNAAGKAVTYGVPVLVIVWIVLAIISAIIFRYTTFGRNVFACGSNVNAARLSGISVRKTLYGAYTVSAIFCAIAGLLSASRLGSGIPTAGDGYEEDAIAAAVIGGASMAGGEGYIGGTVIGALLIQTITNAGTLMGIESNVTRVIIGGLIIVAVLIDRFKKH